MQIYAHRCRGYGYKGHSIRAIRSALQSKVDGIEIDCRLTKDKKWVAIHDPFYVDEQKEVQRIHERTLARLKREVLPLDTVLALFAALGKEKQLFLDVKDVGATRLLIRLLSRHNILDRTVVIAWEPEVLRRVHKEKPELRLGFSYVHIPERLKGVKLSVDNPVSKQGLLFNINTPHSFDTHFRIGKTHHHYLSELPDLPLYSVQVYSLTCSAKHVRQAHEKGMKVIAFVVNNRLNATLLKKRGVDGILTDTPELFLK